MLSGQHRITDVDRAIIQLLEEDGRLSVAAMAQQLELPESTVRRRLNHLLNDGGLRIVAIPDSEKLGLPIHVLIGVQVDVARAQEVAEALAALEEVRWVAMTAGQYDYLAEVFLASNDHFHQFLTEGIAAIPGIQRTETLTIVRRIKHSYSWSELLRAAQRHGEQPGGSRREPEGTQARRDT